MNSYPDFSLDNPDDDLITSKRPERVFEDPYLECLDIITQVTSFLEESIFCRTTIQHRLEDGRTICIYKDKNGSLWYNYKLVGERFSKQIALK